MTGTPAVTPPVTPPPGSPTAATPPPATPPPATPPPPSGGGGWGSTVGAIGSAFGAVAGAITNGIQGARELDALRAGLADRAAERRQHANDGLWEAAFASAGSTPGIPAHQEHRGLAQEVEQYRAAQGLMTRGNDVA